MLGGAPNYVQDYDALPGVDAICTGDGDDVIIDLVTALDKGLDLIDVNGIWFRMAIELCAMKPQRASRPNRQTWPDRQGLDFVTTGFLSKRPW